jgi:hypothetical protein
VMTEAEEQHCAEIVESLNPPSVNTSSPFQPIRKKLGEILIATRQLSPAQLDQAVTLQKQTPKRLGDLLVDLGLVPVKEIQRALRLQKRLLTLLMGTALGVTVLASCSRPIVPGQIPAMADMSIASQWVPVKACASSKTARKFWSACPSLNRAMTIPVAKLL